MKNKNKLLSLLMISTGAVAAIAVLNKCIQVSATSRKLLSKPQSLCYKWRLGNIHYTKTGSGKPLLLLHDMNVASSGYEWSQMISRLKDDYTVYTLDLLGFGLSEKPNMTYTNYLYIQLITDFIQSEIGHRTSVIATGGSASVPVMACASNPELFDQLMLINPLSLADYSQMPGKSAKFYKFVVDLPILGTLLYHMASSHQTITKGFTTDEFYNPYSVKAGYMDAYYESAHLGVSPKSVYASIKCNYTKCNIVNALKKVDNSICLIGGSGISNISERLEEYKIYNPAIETAVIPQTKGLPQLEAPARLQELIKTYLG